MPRDDNDTTLPGESSIIVETATPKITETPADKEQRLRQEQLLAIARKAFRTIDNGESHYRKEAQDDTRFRAGTWGTVSHQWEPGVQQARVAEQRPCMTINRMPGFIRQVTNHARQANLVIKVNPVDDKGDPKLAEVMQGMIRNTERASFADRAYNAGSEKQAEQGRGFIKIITEYASDKGNGADLFRQRPKIKRVMNPLSIYVDLNCREADYSDAEDAFEVTDVDAEAFKEQMGEDAPLAATLEAFAGTGDQTGDWFPNGKIRIAKWYHREAHGPRVHKALLSTGHVIDYPTAEQLVILKEMGESVLQDRWIQRKRIVCRKITALKIYEESIWPGDAQPFIPVVGDELEIDGEKDWRGVVRDSKESGKVYNVEVSSLVEQVGLGPKVPLIGYRGQFGAEGSAQRNAWKSANTKPHPFLEVDPMDIDGKPAPLPVRNSFELPLQGTILAIHQTDEDYKTTAGFRDASLGERGPQESGKAIALRKDQDELGSSHYLDNLKFALSAVGRQLIQIYRVLYDTPTILRITGNDNKARRVMVYSGAERDPRNEKFQQTDPMTGHPVPFAMPQGMSEADLFDLSAGEFDVEVTAAPDTGTRRQEAVEAMTALFHGLAPEVSAKFLDLYFLVMDFPMAQQMFKRAQKLLPPELRDDDDETKPPIPPEVQQKMAEMGQQLEAAMAALQGAKEELRIESRKVRSQFLLKQEEYASRERIEVLKIRARLLEQAITAKAEGALALLQAELAALDADAARAHEMQMAAVAQADALEQGDQEHQHGMEAGAVEHGQNLEAGAVEQGQALQAGAAEHGQNLEAGAVQHQQNLEAGRVQHEQQLQSGDVAHRQALELAQTPPPPDPNKKPTA